jgi:hypothetical protein
MDAVPLPTPDDPSPIPEAGWYLTEDARTTWALEGRGGTIARYDPKSGWTTFFEAIEGEDFRMRYVALSRDDYEELLNSLRRSGAGEFAALLRDLCNERWLRRQGRQPRAEQLIDVEDLLRPKREE